VPDKHDRDLAESWRQGAAKRSDESAEHSGEAAVSGLAKAYLGALMLGMSPQERLAHTEKLSKASNQGRDARERAFKEFPLWRRVVAAPVALVYSWGALLVIAALGWLIVAHPFISLGATVLLVAVIAAGLIYLGKQLK
jgi:hypothetical protein